MIRHFLLPELIDCDIGELAQCKITVSDWLNTLLAYLFISLFNLDAHCLHSSFTRLTQLMCPVSCFFVLFF